MFNINLQASINKLEDILSTKTPEDKNQLYKKLDIDFKNQFMYLDINAQSFASGLIDLNTSQFLYNKLRDYTNTSLAERIVIAQLMADLLQKRRAA